jgi:hypothetical protein
VDLNVITLGVLLVAVMDTQKLGLSVLHIRWLESRVSGATKNPPIRWLESRVSRAQKSPPIRVIRRVRRGGAGGGSVGGGRAGVSWEGVSSTDQRNTLSLKTKRWGVENEIQGLNILYG